MFKKLLVLGVALVIIFCLIVLACRHPVEKFNNLAEMQEALPSDFYYFDLEQDGIKETRFEATKRKKKDGSYTYIQYFIWYDVEYMVDGKIVTRKLQVIAAAVRHTIAFLDKEVTLLDAQFDSQPNLISIDENWYKIEHSAKKNRLLLTLGIKNEEGYWYYFVLDDTQNPLAVEEIEQFASICEIAINNRYKK